MFLSRFLADRRGNFALTTAVAILPILVSAGIAVDYSMVSRYDSRLQNAVDAATLAAGAELGQLSDGQVHAVVRQYLQANLEPEEYERVGQIDIDIDRSAMKLAVSASARMKPAFGGIVGLSAMDYGGAASIQAGWGGIEAVLVLDNTGSMGREGKLDALKTAARSFVEDLLAVNGGGDRVKIGIVPFSAHVNVGLDNRHAGWLNVPADSSAQSCTKTPQVVSKSGCRTESGSGHGEDGPYTYQYEVCESYEYGDPVQSCSQRQSVWHGCVGSREHPFNLKDANFNLKVPGVLDSGAANTLCPGRLTELTNDRAKLLGEISRMTANGLTYIPAGLAWGQRVLSSAIPFTEGTSEKAARKKNIDKAVVLMTDGANTLVKNPKGANHIRSSDVGQADRWTLEICDSIKKDGTSLYTVGFGKDIPPATLAMLRQCASGSDSYFAAADAAQLKAVFADIAGRLTKLYLTQ